MPASSSSSANAKRKQDEKHYNILKELLAQDCNKKCFDCGQRGPVYVNMTIGAFVCTSCSGLLRGMNTPHRVKSVSMASFTPEEMDFIQKRGNDACYCIWMGRYEASRKFGGGDAFPESKDEHRLREYMHKKYEQKKWYVSEATALAEYEQVRQKNLAAQKPAESSKSSTKPHIPVPLNGNFSQKQVSKSSSNEANSRNPASSENKTATKSTTSNNKDLDLIFGTGPSNVGSTATSIASNIQHQNTTPSSKPTQPVKDPFAADSFPNSGAPQNNFDPFTSFQSNADSVDQAGFAAFPPPSAQNTFVADFGEMKVSSPVVSSTPQSSLNLNSSVNSGSSNMASAAVKEDKYAILASLDEEMKSSANKNTWSESMTVKRDHISSNQGLGSSSFGSPQGVSSYPVSWNSQTSQVGGMNQYGSNASVYSYSGGFPNADMGVNPFGGASHIDQTTTTPGYSAFGNFSSPQVQPSNPGSNPHVANPFVESNWGGGNNAFPAGGYESHFSQPFNSSMTAAGNTMSGGISNYGGTPALSQSHFGTQIHQNAISTGAPNAMTNGAAFHNNLNSNQFTMAAQPFGVPQGFSAQTSIISSANFPMQHQQPMYSNFGTMNNSPFSVQPNAQNLQSIHQQPVNDWSRSPIPPGASMGPPQGPDPFASLATGMKSSVQFNTSGTSKSPNPWPNQATSTNPSVNSAATMKANPFLD